jgi:hypothetical protein
MTHTARIKIAAAVVVLFMAALSAAGLLAHTSAPVTGQASSALQATPAPTQIHPLTFQYESND